MKTTMTISKALKAACLTVLAALAAAPAFASYDPMAAVAQEFYDSRYVTAASSVPFAGNDTMAVRLYYTGTSTEAVVTISATGITFYAPNNVADTTFGASGQLTFATYGTIGALCDKINTSAGVYQCRMEDARRSDPTAYLAAVTAASGQLSLKANGGYPVGFSPGANAAFSVYGSTWISLGITPPADARVILKKCTFEGLGSGYVRFTVSGVKRVAEGAPDGIIRNDSSVIWSSTGAVTTSTTISFDDSGYGGITFAKANQGIPGPSSGLPAPQSTIQVTPPNSQGRVVVRVDSDGASSTNQGPVDFLYCQWVYRQ